MQRPMATLLVIILLLLLPAVLPARADQPAAGSPPVAQPLVREGDFAVRLGAALEVTTTDDEVEAESELGELGIAPRNGWIADYPVTPDIVTELQQAVAAAAEDDRLEMEREEALQKFHEVAAGFGLAVRPHAAGTPYEPTPASCANYPNPAQVKEAYDREGAPVVTYYCPPPNYYGLYAWVPAPFWWADLWFAGFFVLHDFHRVVPVQRRVVVLTNHFRDSRTQRAFRVDPVERFRGRTFAGIGVSRPRDFISTGVPGGERTIFNVPRQQRGPGTTVTTPPRGGERIRQAPRDGGRGREVPRGGERGRSPSGRGGSMERQRR